MCLSRDQLLAQDFDAVLAGRIKLAGDNIFAKFCYDALSHTLGHPRSKQTGDLAGMGWYGWRLMGMGLDWGLGLAGWVTGRESCGPEMVLLTLQLHFLDFDSLWMGLGRSWA